MRKAGVALRKNRRNSKDKQDSPSSDDGSRQPSQEELALTAKNYRLAKELSELRVRHREECRAVTRLSMDNVRKDRRKKEMKGVKGIFSLAHFSLCFR
jgi:hypothetical protein